MKSPLSYRPLSHCKGNFKIKIIYGKLWCLIRTGRVFIESIVFSTCYIVTASVENAHQGQEIISHACKTQDIIEPGVWKEGSGGQQEDLKGGVKLSSRCRHSWMCRELVLPDICKGRCWKNHSNWEPILLVWQSLQSHSANGQPSSKCFLWDEQETQCRPSRSVRREWSTRCCMVSTNHEFSQFSHGRK